MSSIRSIIYVTVLCGLPVLTHGLLSTAVPRRATCSAAGSDARRCVAPRPTRAPLVQMNWVQQLKASINEGERSTRGEGWAFGQAGLLLAIIFAPPEPLLVVVHGTSALPVLVGISAVVAAVTLAVAAVKDLGLTNLTPWPKPVARNELKTEGVYSLCRHPMYTCLITFCLGLSLLNQSFDRLLYTIALFVLLTLKAGREEAFLQDKHGERYRAYSAYVPQFFPKVTALQEYLRAAR